MFLLRRPSSQDIEAFHRSSLHLPLSYAPVGLAHTGARGFSTDEHRVRLGTGEAAFARAKDALTRWSQFDLGWARVFPQRPPLEPGSTVVVVVRHYGAWSMHGCRVVYGVGTCPRSEFGFGYGTLTNHAECGEEVFRVFLEPTTGEVWYSIRAASRPSAVLARIGYPFTRALQSRFRRDSAAAMSRAVAPNP